MRTTGGLAEALVLKARLEAERIPVHLSYDSAGSVYGFASTGLGAVHVMVPEAFAEAALSICEEADRTSRRDSGGTAA